MKRICASFNVYKSDVNDTQRYEIYRFTLFQKCKSVCTHPPTSLIRSALTFIKFTQKNYENNKKEFSRASRQRARKNLDILVSKKKTEWRRYLARVCAREFFLIFRCQIQVLVWWRCLARVSAQEFFFEILTLDPAPWGSSYATRCRCLCFLKNKRKTLIKSDLLQRCSPSHLTRSKISVLK